MLFIINVLAGYTCFSSEVDYSNRIASKRAEVEALQHHHLLISRGSRLIDIVANTRSNFLYLDSYGLAGVSDTVVPHIHAHSN